MFLTYMVFCLFGISTCFIAATVANEAIVGGVIAYKGQFPYQVSIMMEDQVPFCGGGIIGDKHILTAAHCVVHPNGQIYPQPLFVLAVKNNMFETQFPAITIPVHQIFVPIKYNGTDISTTDDIAVLKLMQPLGLQHNKHLKRLSLPKNQREPYVNRTAILAGFGWNSIRFVGPQRIGNNSDGYLRFVETDIIGMEECQQGFVRVRISDKHICARSKQQHNVLRSPCFGDSGSPLVIDDRNVIGILSRSPTDCNERIKSSIYTRVSHYLTFISNAVKGKITKNMYASQLQRIV